jgi:hypothetical protein
MDNKVVSLCTVILLGIITYSLVYYTPSSFSIFLTRENKLVINERDIVSYDSFNHQFILTFEGMQKIKSLKVGVYGEPFVIKIYNKDVLSGAFWTPISSIGYKGIIIEVPFENINKITIQSGYPTNYPDNEIDDQEIINYFRIVGKLNI